MATLIKREFFSNGIKIGESTTNPFSYTWSGAPLGVQSLTVKDTYDDGGTAESLAVNISVNQGSVGEVPAYTADALTIPYITASGYQNNGTVYFAGTPQETTGAMYAYNIDKLVKDLKAATGASDLSTVFAAIYPRHGDTVDKIKFNLLNPVDSDAAFRLTYTGVFTFSPAGHRHNGVSAGGTNVKGNYWNTHLILSGMVSPLGWGAITTIASDNPPSAFRDTLISANVSAQTEPGVGNLAIQIEDNKTIEADIEGTVNTSVTGEDLRGIYALVKNGVNTNCLFKNGVKRATWGDGQWIGAPDVVVRGGSSWNYLGEEQSYELSNQIHLNEMYIKILLTDQQIIDVMTAISDFEGRIGRKTW